MDWARHEEIFSVERMERYLIACNQHADVAIKLYKYNIQASQTLYPILSTFEVSLRNALDRAIADFFADKDWLMSKRAQFADHSLMVQRDSKGMLRPDPYFGNKLMKAEKWLRLSNKTVTHGRLLSEMTFGFWLKFFEGKSIRILQAAPLNALI